ncbi:hypothetical protein A9Q99_19670 [Gammaproteobacteria bacterium 45_16_T64]|nr:hypothetical protein A9Q99_19670 [Gammaproteobacteria bacterium 45_16_T64]
MLTLNCTKAAADFFSTTKKGKKTSPLEAAPKQSIPESIPEPNAPLQWQWLVHAIKVNGKNVLIAMDYQTRFSITLSALKKGDDQSFLNSLEHHLTVHIHEMMIAVNASPQTIEASLERYLHQHQGCAFYLRGDRSVQAHINDVAWHFRHWVEDWRRVPTGVDLIGLDIFVNQLLRKRKAEKNYFTPQHEFLHAWLIHYGEYCTAQADECIDRLKAKERADFAARHPDLVTPTEHADNVISLDAHRKK